MSDIVERNLKELDYQSLSKDELVTLLENSRSSYFETIDKIEALKKNNLSYENQNLEMRGLFFSFLGSISCSLTYGVVQKNKLEESNNVEDSSSELTIEN